MREGVVGEKIRGPLSHLLAIRGNSMFSRWRDANSRTLGSYNFAEFEKPIIVGTIIERKPSSLLIGEGKAIEYGV
jgi:hypothetical protein